MKTLHTNYKVGTGDITVTVVVGNGQRGNTLVAVGSEELANGPNITNLAIGKGSDLAGKTLTLLTTVSQTNTSTQNAVVTYRRSEEHTSELQSRPHLVCRLLLEKKK